MVIQQIPSTESWSGVRPPALPKKADLPKKKSKRGLLPVVAVQSIACGVLLLMALLLQVAGGEPYRQLRSRFHSELMSNNLLEAVASLWDGDPTPEQTVAEQEAAAADAVVTVAALPPLQQGVVTSSYGYRSDPTGSGEEFHAGVDIAAADGSPIAAMYDGSVKEVGESNSLGHYVRLSHRDGVEVLYAHCSAVTVTEGTAVKAGDTVAAVGSTGDSTGAHLHIEVRTDGALCDPASTVPLEQYA